MRPVPAIALAVLSVVVATACQTRKGESEGPDDGASAPAAVVEGETIRVAEVDAFIKDELFERESRGGQPARVYELRNDALGRMLARRVVEGEAERRGISAEELIRAESEALGDVSDEEVAAFYEENQARMRGASLEQVAPSVREHLREQRGREVVRSLIEDADVDVVLEPPRVEIAADGPTLGPDDAAVTIVEFSDFQCPYCQRATPVLDEIRERYPEQVRVVYRHLPLDQIHPRARAAALASECAHDQDAFWEYHDVLFENPQSLSDADLRGYAEALGLDPEPFAECLASGRHEDKVSADVAAAREIGITGTPAFVVNGIVLFGLQTSEELDEIVRQELGEDEEPASGDA